jgi:polyhydroxyalkanoate synthase subunit PhaC
MAIADRIDQLLQDAASWLADVSDAATGRKTLAEQVLLHLGRELHGVLESLRARATGTTPPPTKKADADPAADRRGFADTARLLLAQALTDPPALARHYAAFAAEALKILEGRSELAPDPGDFRFKDALWRDSLLLKTILQLYLELDRSLRVWLDDMPVSQGDRRRILFLIEQAMAGLAPSNLPLNPSALRRAEMTQGTSAATGLRHWIDDALNNRFMPRQIRPGAYKVGRDLALTPGAVVYRDEVLELIQYAPQTLTVRRRPILLLPPQINKYYIFDLKPQNSFIGYILKAGLQVFVISWRNPTAEQGHWSLDTYVASLLGVIEAMRSITKSQTLGLISACAGGLTAMALLGYLGVKGRQVVTNHSLLVTCLFPNEGSDLELFATPELLERAREEVQAEGVMEGADLARVFFWMRPTDLVWRYWINNYLLGKDPPRLDVLQWDNDPTRLPAALHGDFLDMHMRDVFRRPGALRVFGQAIDFRKMKVDTYVVGGEDDGMMPWRGCFRTCQEFRGRHEFVLSTSGHVQSIIRPPRVANKYYHVNDAIRKTPDEWLSSATRVDGSWWGHWHTWLNTKSGAIKKAPTVLGAPSYPPLMPAPGRYVLE